MTREELIQKLNKNNRYFDATFVKSKGAIWNFFMSDRSDGKTMNCKILALIDFYLYDHAHVYARRYDTEMSVIMKSTFMNKLLRLYPWINKIMEFASDDIGIKAKRLDRDEDFKYMIYFIPISMSGKLKSQIEDERITDIDFDEYIPLDNKYLKEEMKYCCELYKTCDRDRDTVRFNFFGNKITSFNPFFDFFDIQMSIASDKIRLYKDNTIAVQIYKSKALAEERLKSKFTKSVSGTDYEDYNASGILQQQELNMDSISNAMFYLSFRSVRGEGSIWVKDNYYIVSTKKYGDGLQIVDKMYVTKRKTLNCLDGNVQKLFKHAYKINKIYFETERAFYLFEPILRKINIS